MFLVVNIAAENMRSTILYFDADIYPDYTLEAFNQFIQLYELRYNAHYSDPPKVWLNAAIERWRLTTEVKDAKIDLEQYDTIREEMRRTKSQKYLACFCQKVCMKTGKLQKQTSANEGKQHGNISFLKCIYTGWLKKKPESIIAMLLCEIY